MPALTDKEAPALTDKAGRKKAKKEKNKRRIQRHKKRAKEAKEATSAKVRRAGVDAKDSKPHHRHPTTVGHSTIGFKQVSGRTQERGSESEGGDTGDCGWRRWVQRLTQPLYPRRD